jgi:hypothetical protein
MSNKQAITEQKHPAALALESAQRMNRIHRALQPSTQSLNCEARISQFAVALIDIIVTRIDEIDNLLDGETFGFSEPLNRLREAYTVQMKLLQTVKDFAS